MTIKWAGKVLIGDGIAFYVGRTGDNDMHTHYAIQIALSYKGLIRVTDKANRKVTATGVVIPANTPHRVCADGQQKIAFIYFEPHSERGRALMAQFPFDGNSTYQLAPYVVSSCIRELDIFEQGISSGSCDTNAIVSLLTCVNAKPLTLDDRVQKAMDYIRNHLEDVESLDSLAVMLEISPRYLRRLFEQQVGMSLQRFRLWTKMRTALDRIAAGARFTEAAHAASFTDSAHFSRTFRDMFGIAPSAVMANSRVG